MTVALLIGLPRSLPFLARRPRTGFRSGLERTDKIILALALVVMALCSLYASARVSYNSAVEYFSNEKIMAVLHTPVYTYPKDLFPVSSFHSGILFTALIQVFGDQSARMLSWLNGVEILILGVAIGKELGMPPRARAWFVALMLTTTAFVDLLGDGKVDVVSTAPLVASIYWIIRSEKEPAKPIFALIGLLAGFGMIARPYNLFLMPLFAIIFYTMRQIGQKPGKRLPTKDFWQAAIWVVPPMFALRAFHLWQNWQWLGSPWAPLIAAQQLNPVAPLIAGGQSDARVWWQWQFDPKMLNTYRILYPFTVTFMNSPQSLGNISPFFLELAPFLLLRRIPGEPGRTPNLVMAGASSSGNLGIVDFAFQHRDGDPICAVPVDRAIPSRGPSYGWCSAEHPIARKNLA